MSIKTMNSVWDHSKASGNTLLVLLCLADHADFSGDCFPSVPYIARRCRLSERTVQDHLAKLVDLGEIVRDERPGRSTIYHIRTPAESAPPQDSHPRSPAQEPPQDSHPTPADSDETPAEFAPITVRTTKEPTTEPLEASDASGADPAPTSKQDIRPEIVALCDRLRSKIIENGTPEARVTVGKGWHDAIRLLIDRDGRTPQQVANMIDWCQADPFWRANILSAPTLRDKYDQMRLQATREIDAAKARDAEQRPVRDYAPRPPKRPEDLPFGYFAKQRGEQA